MPVIRPHAEPSPQLLDALRHCLQWLHDECVRRRGTSYVRVSVSSQELRAMHGAPPMKAEGEIAGTPFSELLRLLYVHDASSAEHAMEVWARVAPYMDQKVRTHDILEEFRSVFPFGPFGLDAGMDPRYAAVQFLTLCTYFGGTLKFEDAGVDYRNGAVRLRLYKQAIEWPGGYRRHRAPLPFTSVWASRRKPLAKYRRLAVVSALVKHLKGVIPELKDEIDLLFHIVSWTGRRTSLKLARIFDIEVTTDGADMDAVNDILEFQQLLRNV